MITAKFYNANIDLCHTFQVYACDIKPAARKLALELGAVEAFDLLTLDKKIKEGFTPDITIDFAVTSQSKLSLYGPRHHNDRANLRFHFS